MTNRDKFEEIVMSGKDTKQIFKDLKEAFPEVDITTDKEGFSIKLDTQFLKQEYYYEKSSSKSNRSDDYST